MMPNGEVLALWELLVLNLAFVLFVKHKCKELLRLMNIFALMIIFG
jgi:hypothetical protein